MHYLNEDNQAIYADSAYIGKSIPEHIESCVHEKELRNKPLTSEKKESNRKNSKTTWRIEHVFGFMTVPIHDLTVRTIGIQCAAFNLGLTNLVYNIWQYAIMKRRAAILSMLCPETEKSE